MEFQAEQNLRLSNVRTVGAGIAKLVVFNIVAQGMYATCCYQFGSC